MGIAQVFEGVRWLSESIFQNRKGCELPMNAEDLTNKVFDLDERVTRHTEQIKTCFDQIDETRSMAESVHKLATTVEILALELKSTNKKMDRLTQEVEEIKEKPAKRWDSVVGIFITAVATAIVTFLLTRLGLS